MQCRAQFKGLIMSYTIVNLWPGILNAFSLNVESVENIKQVCIYCMKKPAKYFQPDRNIHIQN